MKLEQMSNLEREAFLLEHLFGLRVFPSWTAKEREPEVYPFAVYDRRVINDPCSFLRVYHPHNLLGGGGAWAPTRDVGDAFEVEEKIAESGHVSRYVDALCRVIRVKWEREPSVGDLWLLINATAKQRVEAACLVLMEGKSRRAAG